MAAESSADRIEFSSEGLLRDVFPFGRYQYVEVFGGNGDLSFAACGLCRLASEGFSVSWLDGYAIGVDLIDWVLL